MDAGDVFAVRLPGGNAHSVAPLSSSVCDGKRKKERKLLILVLNAFKQVRSVSNNYCRP